MKPEAILPGIINVFRNKFKTSKYTPLAERLVKETKPVESLYTRQPVSPIENPFKPIYLVKPITMGNAALETKDTTTPLLTTLLRALTAGKLKL
jgi:hypothetical protein